MSEVKWLRHDADHSAPSMAKVNNEWSYTSAVPASSWYADGQFYHSYLCVSTCSGIVLTDTVRMSYSSYETDTKKIPFIANRFSVRFEVFTVVKIHIVVFKVMTQLFCPEDGGSFSKALVSMHHTIQILDKLMSCGWMWLTACLTHLPFHIVQSQLAVLNVAGKM